MIDRRMFVASSMALSAAGAAKIVPRAADRFADLRIRLGPGGRLGIAALDTRSGRRILSDADSRFAMSSTFKVALAGAVLAEAEARRLSLADPITFTRADLVSYAPVIEAALGAGWLSIETLCTAIVQKSDNAAANLLLKRIGGPAALTRFFRSSGDRLTRLDRWETELNSNIPGDPRDTTTPSAMLETIRSMLIGNRLRPASRALLGRWMIGTTTGLTRLRAGLPQDWAVGDKTGTGARGSYNDLVITWPPGRKPILIAAYLDGGNVTNAARDEIHQAIARRIAASFA